jgi:hypothetical protein
MDLDIKHKLMKGAVSGGVAAAGAWLMGTNGSGAAFGVPMPALAAVALSSGAGSVAADVAHQFIFPFIPTTESMKTAESAVLATVISGGVTSYGLNDGQGMMATFALGAGSNFVADGVTYGFVLSGGGHQDSSFF